MGKIHLNLSSFIVFDICIAITGLYPETAICVCTLPKKLDLLGGYAILYNRVKLLIAHAPTEVVSKSDIARLHSLGNSAEIST